MISKQQAAHTSMDQFSIKDGELIIGGIPVTQLVHQVGQTPFYAYDRKLITQRVELLRKHLPEDIHLHYAVKANPMPDVLQHLAPIIDGFDIASAGEMKRALATGMTANHISFAGPGKTDDELELAIISDVIVNLESRNEMHRLEMLANRLGKQPKVAIRINPDFELRSSGMRMGGGAKPFGIDAEATPQILKELKSLNLEFMGFHIFWGSQNLCAKTIQEAHKKTFELAIGLSEQAPSAVKYLNIGGGFGIPYFPGERHLDLKPIGENLYTLLPKIKSHFPEADIITELGRYIVGEAGLYICKVIDKKISRGETFLVTNGGLHHHLAATGNFGQVIRKNYPLAIANRMDGTKTEIVNIVGPLCTPLDLLGSKVSLPKAEINDLVAVYQSGAYGLTASPQKFLLQSDCAEVLV